MKKWYKKWWGIIILLFIALILTIFFSFVFYVISVIKQPRAPINTDNQQNTDLGLIENENNYWLGSSDPKVTIVEFSDFSCPFCYKAFPKIREISQKYKNDVKIIYRDFPVVSEYSSNLALAARCAGEQGLFWPMHDKLFINQGVSEKDELFELAGQVGVNEKRFTNCYNSNKYLPQIKKDLSDGEKLEITGTPTWFINGEKLAGDIPYNIFIEIIEQIIK